MADQGIKIEFRSSGHVVALFPYLLQAVGIGWADSYDLQVRG